MKRVFVGMTKKELVEVSDLLTWLCVLGSTPKVKRRRAFEYSMKFNNAARDGFPKKK
jgi:hypothetical protein